MNFETLLEIDLKKLKNNTRLLCKSYNDYKYKIASLKNNAHGMGFKITNTLINNGINYIMVGALKDALEIRKYNSEIPILVNYYVDIDGIYDAINNNITVTIYNLEYLKKILELKIKDTLNVELLIDNGSNKQGFDKKTDLKEAINLINDSKYIKLRGLYTDITTLGVIDNHYYIAVDNFYKLIKEFVNEDLVIHLNEPIMYHHKLSYVNGIRFDLSLIGIEENINDNFATNMKIKSIEKKYGDLEFPGIDLKLIFNITSEVMAIKYAPKGSLVGRNYVAPMDMLVAVIPVGHKDGITKAIKYVGINNYKRNILTDEIDYLIVEADDNMQIKDKVYIINEEREIYDFLTLLNTNRYYLMSVLNKDLRKEYINNEESSDDYL